MSSNDNNGDTESRQVIQPSNEEKEVFFIVLKPSEEKINFKKLQFVSDIIPKNIFKKSIEKGNGLFLEEIVFKCDKKSNKSYEIQYIEGDDTYIISFFAKENSFVYLTEFKKGNKYLDNIVKEDIDQNIIPFYNKLYIFLEALKACNENNKIEKLYEDTIDFYEKKKKFSLLISLFLEIYEHNKNLCIKLLKIFNEISDQENTDRDNELLTYLDTFNQIYLNADDIIKKNEYNKVNFYGILFCYLHYYDKNNFPKIIQKFSDGNSDILYEILIKYYSHFMNPLDQGKEFYNGFIKYALKKDKELNIFKRILNYIDDIETFLFVINDNKEQIFKKYDRLKLDPIQLTSGLKLIRKKYG